MEFLSSIVFHTVLFIPCNILENCQNVDAPQYRGTIYRAVIDIADIDVSIKMSFDIHIDTEKRHIDIEKWYMYIA